MAPKQRPTCRPAICVVHGRFSVKLLGGSSSSGRVSSFSLSLLNPHGTTVYLKPKMRLFTLPNLDFIERRPDGSIRTGTCLWWFFTGFCYLPLLHGAPFIRARTGDPRAAVAQFKGTAVGGIGSIPSCSLEKRQESTCPGQPTCSDAPLMPFSLSLSPWTCSCGVSMAFIQPVDEKYDRKNTFELT